MIRFFCSSTQYQLPAIQTQVTMFHQKPQGHQIRRPENAVTVRQDLHALFVKLRMWMDPTVSCTSQIHQRLNDWTSMHTSQTKFQNLQIDHR
jgi:hypothetical protein